MAIDNIDATDNLNTGRVKLNQAIDQTNLSEIDSATAIATADTAVVIANTADAKSTTTQDQLDTIVIASGTSDAETIQARGGEPLLYNRLDKVDTQMAQTMQRFSYVTPEMYGAVGDGVSDDTQAIFDADTYAFNNGLKLVGIKKYLLSQQWTIKSNFVDFLKGGIKLSDNFPVIDAIIATGNFYNSAVRHDLMIDGNRSNQTLAITSYKVIDLHSYGYHINLVVDNCFNGLSVMGAVERSRFNIHGKNTNRLVIDKEGGSTGDTTPDENFYYISGGSNCEQFYAKESQAIAFVTFNTEGSASSTPYEYLVDIYPAGSKNVQLLGIIRMAQTNVLKVRNNSACHFNGLTIYNPMGLGLFAENASYLTGDIIIQHAQVGAAHIRRINGSSQLNIHVQSYRGGTAVIIGDIDADVINSLINVHVTSANSDDDILDVRQATYSTIYCNYSGAKPTTKGIQLGASSDYTLHLGYNIMQQNIHVVADSIGVSRDIKFLGRSVFKDKLLVYPTPVAGMKVYSRDFGGRLVTYTGSNWQITDVTTI